MGIGEGFCKGPQLNPLIFPTYTVVRYKITKYDVRGEGVR